MSKIKAVTIHGGHNPQGKIACGASDYIDESREDRIITKKVIRLLKKNGIKAYDCTVNNGTSQTDVLRKICEKCNSKTRDIDISIHFKLSKIGFKNRGVKTTSGLWFLNKTSKPALLVEVCFVSDPDDAKLYKANKDNVAKAIVQAILNYNKVH